MAREAMTTPLAAYGYPSPGEPLQSSVWLPFLREPSYDPMAIEDCDCLLVHRLGTPRLLVCSSGQRSELEAVALDTKVFETPPHHIVTVENGHLAAFQLQRGAYRALAKMPRWEELDRYPAGSYAIQRADAEVSAVRERFETWLKDPLSKRAVERLMSVHTQRAGVVKELIQNACDCFATDIEFLTKGNELIFRHNGDPFMPSNVHAITTLNYSCKPPGAIGYKGIGFKAVYQVCQRPHISSGPFEFAFEPLARKGHGRASSLSSYLPAVDRTTDAAPRGWTEFRLPMDETHLESMRDALSKLEGILLLFVASRHLPLRRLSLPDRSIELSGNSENMNRGGVVTITEDGTRHSWFFVKHRFTMGADRETAIDEFAAATGRDDIGATVDEDLTIASPVIADENGNLVPDSTHRGRFHAFMATSDEYESPWDINANFLVDSPREHLLPANKDSWNEALLRECGKLLLQFLDETRMHTNGKRGTPLLDYYNAMPAWNEAGQDQQTGQFFQIMRQSFHDHFEDTPRVPVHSGNAIAFESAANTVWLERNLLPLFDISAWQRLLPSGKRLTCAALSEERWRQMLIEVNATAYGVVQLASCVSSANWPSLIGIDRDASIVPRVAARLLCFFGAQGVKAKELKQAWIVPDSKRRLHTAVDRSGKRPIRRLSDDDLGRLPLHVRERINLVHDGVLRFLQRDPSYFSGAYAVAVTDSMRTAGRILWFSLVRQLSLENIIVDWVNPTFEEADGLDTSVVERRMDWLRFLFRNRALLDRKYLTYLLKVTLPATTPDGERWLPPEQVWLSSVCPQGQELEVFIDHTPGVFLASKKLQSLVQPQLLDSAALGAYLIGLGTRSYIHTVPLPSASFPPSRAGKQDFCDALGIDRQHLPAGDINYHMKVKDDDLHPDIVAALQNAVADDANPHRRLDRLRSFARLLDQSWAERIEKSMRGSYHVTGARDDQIMTGRPSTAVQRLAEAAWVPVMGQANVLKRPRETCRYTDVTRAYAGTNFADIVVSNGELLDSLGFDTKPAEYSTLDALRVTATSGVLTANRRAEFEKLYLALWNEIKGTGDAQEYRAVFGAEPLLFVPTDPPRLRTSNEVLRSASRFDGYLENIGAYYTEELDGFFQAVGVANQVDETHYLRYLVFHIWKEQPSIDERRRGAILTCYRELANWSRTVLPGTGIWATQEGQEFCRGMLFFGDCAGSLGWFSGLEKTVVYRDDPLCAEILAKSDKYVIESFLPQLRRTEESLDPFLERFGVERASRLVRQELKTDSHASILPASSNLRHNFVVMLERLTSLAHLRREAGHGGDAQTGRFMEQVELARAAAPLLNLYRCEELQKVAIEVATSSSTHTSVDAALELDGSQPGVYIVGGGCIEVSSELARGMKSWLRTDLLSEEIGGLVEGVVEDLVGWLDHNPDAFLGRLRRVLHRHAHVATEGPYPDTGPIDIKPESVEGTDEDDAGVDDNDEYMGSDVTATKLKLPEKGSQGLGVQWRPVSDFSSPTGDSEHGERKRRARGKKERRLSAEQRREIGRRAEELVVGEERRRLRVAGRSDLAEKVIDRNETRYDPYGPYDVDSFVQNECGEWVSAMIEVKGHLGPDIDWFDMSRNELRMALSDSPVKYYVCLVTNVGHEQVHGDVFDFSQLWRENRLGYQARTVRISLHRAEQK